MGDIKKILYFSLKQGFILWRGNFDIKNNEDRIPKAAIYTSSLGDIRFWIACDFNCKCENITDRKLHSSLDYEFRCVKF